MNRKSNPWVALVARLLLLVLISSTCAACDIVTDATETETPRFTVELASDNSRSPDQQIYIITDTATGVQYLFFHDYRAGGLTKLEPAPEEEAPEE